MKIDLVLIGPSDRQKKLKRGMILRMLLTLIDPEMTLNSDLKDRQRWFRVHVQLVLRFL